MELIAVIERVLSNTDIGFGVLTLGAFLVLAYSISSQRADHRISNDVAMKHIELVSNTTKAISSLESTMKVVENSASSRDGKIVEAINILNKNLDNTNAELKKFEQPVKVISDLAHANNTLLGELKSLNEKTISRYDLVASALQRMQEDITILLKILQKENPSEGAS